MYQERSGKGTCIVHDYHMPSSATTLHYRWLMLLVISPVQYQSETFYDDVRSGEKLITGHSDTSVSAVVSACSLGGLAC